MMEQGRTYTLATGLELLDEWSDGARQAHKNLLYKALFAVADGSVFHHYGVLAGVETAPEYFVLIREDLVLKIELPDEGAFGIVYIGPVEDAPGLDLALEAA